MEPPQIRTSFSCFSFLDAMYTFAPFCTYAAAIMLPIPEPPPVITAAHTFSLALYLYPFMKLYSPTLPFTSNRDGVVKSTSN